MISIGGFVASGFEHCVANMYFITMGLVLWKNEVVVAAAEEMAGKTLDISQLTWKGFSINNLFPVTIGVALFWLAYSGLFICGLTTAMVSDKSKLLFLRKQESGFLLHFSGFPFNSKDVAVS